MQTSNAIFMGAFVISQRFNGEYKFEFTSRKGKAVFTSNSYELKFECEEAAEKFRLNVEGSVFVRQKTSSGKFYFRLLIEEKLFAISRKYTTELRLQKGIDEIVKYASRSEILDFTANDFIFPD